MMSNLQVLIRPAFKPSIVGRIIGAWEEYTGPTKRSKTTRSAIKCTTKAVLEAWIINLNDTKAKQVFI